MTKGTQKKGNNQSSSLKLAPKPRASWKQRMLGEGLKGLGRDGLEAVCQGAGLLRGHNPGNTGWNRMNTAGTKNSNRRGSSASHISAPLFSNALSFSA